MREEALTSKQIFYKEFRATNASLILGLIIISFGTYLIPWFYRRSKQFGYLDKDAPDAQRVAAIIAIIPLGWFIIIRILKNLVLTGVLGEIIEIVGWGLIFFLIVKFLYDFTLSFGKITNTKGLYWFIMLLLGSIGIIATIMKFYYLSILLGFIIFVIPAMQLELNSHFSKITIKKNSNVFYE